MNEKNQRRICLAIIVGGSVYQAMHCGIDGFFENHLLIQSIAATWWWCLTLNRKPSQDASMRDLARASDRIGGCDERVDKR